MNVAQVALVEQNIHARLGRAISLLVREMNETIDPARKAAKRAAAVQLAEILADTDRFTFTQLDMLAFIGEMSGILMARGRTQAERITLERLAVLGQITLITKDGHLPYYCLSAYAK
jgi:hypothetical protein